MTEPTIERKRLGFEIHERIKALGLNLGQFAKFCDRSRGTVSNLVTGRDSRRIPDWATYKLTELEAAKSDTKKWRAIIRSITNE